MPGGFGDDDESGGRYQYQGQVDPNAPSVANGQISPAQWAEYQARRRRDAILGALLTAGGTIGLGFAGQALTGAGAGAAGASASAAPEISVGTGSAAGLSAPTLGTVATGGYGGAGAAGAAGAAGGIGGAARGLFSGMSPRDWAALGLSGASAIGGALSGRNNDMTPTSATTDPAMAELLSIMSGRLRKSEPLFDSVQSMANGLLPTQYQKGGGGMR